MTTRLSVVAIGIVIMSAALQAQAPERSRQQATVYNDSVNGLTLDDAVTRALE